jgi:hypothetical protein
MIALTAESVALGLVDQNIRAEHPSPSRGFSKAAAWAPMSGGLGAMLRGYVIHP